MTICYIIRQRRKTPASETGVTFKTITTASQTNNQNRPSRARLELSRVELLLVKLASILSCPALPCLALRALPHPTWVLHTLSIVAPHRTHRLVLQVRVVGLVPEAVRLGGQHGPHPHHLAVRVHLATFVVKPDKTK